MMQIYKFLRKLFPSALHGYLTLLLYFFKIKPTVNRLVKSPFNKGIIVLSADFEMAWAFRYSKTKSDFAEKLGLKERENVPRLLNFFDKYRIPVTWATVGHLFLENCNKASGSIPHPQMVRPPFFDNQNWSYKANDWYQHDPCTNFNESPAWYAPDLIQQIVNAEVVHEIGCHTFSHIDCSHDNCPPELFRSELNACIELGNRKNLILKSMVFPGGTHGNYSILKQLGFTNYRKSTRYHIDLPIIDKDGLVLIPSSYNIGKSQHGFSAKQHIRMAKSFIQKASHERMVAHLWFHPSMDDWYISNVLPDILGYIQTLVKDGSVEVLTMGQLADRILEKNHIRNV